MSLHEDKDNQGGMKPMLEILLEADHEVTGKDGIIPAHDDGSHIGIAMKAEDQPPRCRKLTEKGLSLKKSTLLDKRRKLNSRMLRLSDAVEDLMYSSKNQVAVEEEMAQFNFVFKKLQQVHQEYQSLLSEVEKVDEEDWFEEVDERVFAFKHKVHHWLKQVELEHENGSRSSSKSSKSKKSSASRSSGKTKSSSSRSSKDRAMEEKAKLAELMAEAEFLERRQQAENEAQKLKIEEKLAKAKAKSQVFEDMQDSLLLKSGETAKEVGISHEATKVRTSVDVHQFSGKIQNPPTRMKMDDTRTSHQEPLLRSSLKKPREAPSSSSEITGDISRMLCNLLRQQSAPDVDIPVFTGNPLEYHYFMSSFKEAVECKIDNPHGR